MKMLMGRLTARTASDPAVSVTFVFPHLHLGSMGPGRRPGHDNGSAGSQRCIGSQDLKDLHLIALLESQFDLHLFHGVVLVHAEQVPA
jgi:hypothetical protein